MHYFNSPSAFSQEILLFGKKHASHQGESVSLFLAGTVFLAERAFPAFYFALHDSLRDTGPIGRTPPSTQVPQEASYNGNGLAVIIEQFKGFVMVIVLADMVDAHGSLAPSLASKHLFLSRTNAQQGYKCPHNSETAFAKRFQAMLRYSWHKRSWHVIVADPGSGKTVSIRDMAQRVGSPTMLAVTAPKNNEEEQALGDQLYTALGLPLRGHWRTRKPKLMGHLHHSGTEFLVVDDAHDLSFEHLMFIKELTDQGRLQYGHPLGLCLVAAGRGNTIPLKETLDQPDPTWLQFRRRFDKLEPFCRVAGHTSEEVREILETLETIFQPLFLQLNLRKWTSFIYASLTQPFFDPTKSGRVTMDYLMKLVTTALEWAYADGDTEVRAEKLERAAELLVLRRNTLRIIDGAGPNIGDHQSKSTEQGNGNGTKSETGPEREAVQADDELHATETVKTAQEQEQTSETANCTFSGELVPIDLKRFAASSINLVECPDCGRMRSLSPSKGVLRFKPHTRRKQQTPLTEKRWSATGKTDWDVVGG